MIFSFELLFEQQSITLTVPAPGYLPPSIHFKQINGPPKNENNLISLANLKNEFVIKSQLLTFSESSLF